MLQSIALRAVTQAAHNRDRGMACMLGNGTTHRFYLLSKLTGGRNHQKVRTAPQATTANTALFAMRQIIHGWQKKCCRFARTRLCGGKHVAAFEYLRNCPRLNGGWSSIAQFLYRSQNFLVKSKSIKARTFSFLSHIFLFLRCVCSHISHFHSSAPHMQKGIGRHT